MNKNMCFIGGVVILSAAFMFNLCAADAVANQYPPIIQGNVTSQNGQALAIDSSGNRYVTGSFSGTVDFNPGVGADVKTSAGGNDAFVTRFNADGSYAWTQTFGGTNADQAEAVVVSNDGSTIFVSGLFNSTDAQLGGAGTAVTTAGNYDAFVIALDATTGAAKSGFGAGNGIQTFGGTGSDYGYGLAVNSTTLYLTGKFNSAAAKIGGTGNAVGTTGGDDAFVIALDAATGLAQTSFGLASSGIQIFGGTGNDFGSGIALSGGNVYLTGNFQSGNAQIGAAGAGVGTAGADDAFVVALNVSTGVALNTFGQGGSGIQTFGGSGGDFGYAIVSDGTTLYVAGEFQSSNAQIGAVGVSVGAAGTGQA